MVILLSDKKTEIIRILKESNGKSISGEELGEALGISRTMVWKYIKSLQNDGYPITSSQKVGYKLDHVPDVLYSENIMSGLETRLIGRSVIYYDEVDSTNNAAKRIAKESDDGTVVISRIQKSGRGRLGRPWISPEGGIWLSIIIKPKISLEHASRLTILAGIAVTKTMRNMDVDAVIKWPNDVLINKKKVCGILTELNAEIEQIDYVIVGIGINANNEIDDFTEDLRKNSTTLKQETGNPVNQVKLVQNILTEFEQQYIRFNTQPFSSILDEWIELSDTLGKHVTIMTPTRMISGKAIAITENGSLIVRKADGISEEVIGGRCMYEIS